MAHPEVIDVETSSDISQNNQGQDTISSFDSEVNSESSWTFVKSEDASSENAVEDIASESAEMNSESEPDSSRPSAAPPSAQEQPRNTRQSVLVKLWPGYDWC